VYKADWLLAGTPRPVQLEAVRRSYPKVGWGHFLDMRLGKTAVALNEFMLFRRDFGYRWLLVLAPNSFKLDWNVFADFFRIDVPCHIFESSARDEASRFVMKHRDGAMIVVNYEALQSKETMSLLLSICTDQTLIVADESICIKNHASSFFKNALALAKDCGARRVLTGKPTTQGSHDLWSQLRFIGELDGTNYFAFRNAFCNMGGFKGKQVLRGEKGLKNPERLRVILERCSWSARKSEWMAGPGKEYMLRPLDMIHEQREIYNNMHRNFIAELENGVVVTADQIITKLVKLQQITSGFIIDERGYDHDIMPLVTNPKVNETKRILEEELTDKLLVIVNFRHSIDMLMRALKDFEPTFIRGGMTPEAIAQQKDLFNNGPSRVLVGQAKATKFGHMLMGSASSPCLTTLYFENNYSLDDRSQTEERNQGEGQQGVITMMDFVASPMDRAAITALQDKEDVAAAVLGYMREKGVLPRAA
jgi:hypothetical protein